MRAAVNSWTLDVSGKWETAADWSLGVAPTNSQSAIFITNGVAEFALEKVVTIDATTVSSAPGSLNIQNLTVRAPGFPNYLIVTNATFTPLQVTSLTIGAGGVVEIANSELVMKPGSGSLIDDGSFTVGGPLGSSCSTTNAPSVIVGNAGSGQLAISSGTSLMASNVIVGNLPGSSGALTVSGGQLSIVTASSDNFVIDANLTLGNSAGANGALSLTGGSLTVSAYDGTGYLTVGLNGVGQCTVSGGTLSLNGDNGEIGGWVTVGQNSNSQGTLTIDGGQLQLTGGTLAIAYSAGASGQMLISTGAVGGVESLAVGSGGTLTAAGGSVDVSGVVDVEGTLWVTGGQIIDSECAPCEQNGLYISSGLVSVSNGVLQTPYIDMTGGALELSGGSINFVNPESTTTFSDEAAPVWIRGGQLIITNGQINIWNGGVMTISNGLVLAQDINVGLSFGAGTLTLAGGQLVATNGVVVIGDTGIGQTTLSSGTFLVNNVIVGQNSGGQGTLAVPSSNWTVSSSLIVGNCASNASGTVTVEGGGLYVTNSTHTAVLDVLDGQINLNSGTLQANTLVITNSCGLFYQNGGTLIVSNLVLGPELSAVGDGIPNGWKQQYGLNPFDPTLSGKDPDGTGFTVLQDYLAGLNPTNSHSALRIISFFQQGNNLQITWTTAGGKTNAVQAVNGGGYTTNFTDLATFIIGGSGDQTNAYIDIGGATNRPARYYRVRLVP